MNSEPLGAKNMVLLLNANEAAKALSISPRKLWELTAAKEIESVHIGRSVRYAPESIRRFIESRTVRTAR